ncbi:hypothetical protein EYR38_007994 [Pleurotus pulmonarius]|nr:hypothetical protein EYR38_007994 [Pleurotus pulmonarius]
MSAPKPKALITKARSGIWMGVDNIVYCRHNEPAIRFISRKRQNKVFWKCQSMSDSCLGWSMPFNIPPNRGDIVLTRVYVVWEEDLLAPTSPQSVEPAKQELQSPTQSCPDFFESDSETPNSQETMVELPTTPKRACKNGERNGEAPLTPPPSQCKRKCHGAGQENGRSTKRARSQTVNSDTDDAEPTDNQSASSELSLLRTNARLSSLICTLEEEARRADKAKDKQIAALVKQNKKIPPFPPSSASAMPANKYPGISVHGGRVYCAHGDLAAKWESMTDYHPNMLFWTHWLYLHLTPASCRVCAVWDKDLVRALKEVPRGEGKELASYVQALPAGRQDSIPSNISAAIEDVDVTLIRCRDWTRDEQHHKAILRSSRPTQPLPSTSQGKRKRDDESSGSQSPRRVIKKPKVENEVKKVKIENEDTQRHSLLSVKNESDGEDPKGTSKKMKRQV